MRTVREFPTKEAAEQAAFRRYAEQLSESDFWLKVEGTSPPKPDLLCTHSERGPIAFELVAITDPMIARVNAGHADPGISHYCTSDPTARIIRKKLGRKYDSVYPIELLVYNDLLTITPDDVIVEVCRSWLGSEVHQFQRAWYMGKFDSSLIWTR